MTKSSKSKKVQFVTITTQKGNQYNVPEKYQSLSISQIIRNLISDGYTKWQIHKVTGIRYQHIRNVLTAPVKKS